eukprot:COSAG01_NODE_7592_length_3135_cov_1.832016_1_plen_70_part_00
MYVMPSIGSQWMQTRRHGDPMCVTARHGLQGECGLGSALGLLHRPRELGPEPVHLALHRPLPGGRVGVS